MNTENLNNSILSKQAVLYSIQQDCFHIETMGEYLDNNTRRILKKEKDFASFHPIGLFDNYEDASEFIQQFQKLLNKRTFNFNPKNN